MAGFASDWLTLRHAADLRARDGALLARLAGHLASRRGAGALRIVDLGAGTGANLAATAPHLEGPQHWILADADAALLSEAAVPEALAARVTAETREVDLAEGVAGLLVHAPDLVTAQAFFDLAGRAWIEALAEAAARAGTAVYATLTYDGRELWEPPHPDDAAVQDAFRQDQRRDKGLGPAMGPDAAAALAAALQGAGFTVHEGESAWRLEAPRDAALIAALAEGSAGAVRPALGARADVWLAARRSAARVLIGHRDILALP